MRGLLLAAAIALAAAPVSQTEQGKTYSSAEAKKDTPWDAQTEQDLEQESESETEQETEKLREWNLRAPHEVEVFVDGTATIEVMLLDREGEELELDEAAQRLEAEYDGSVARANVDGLSVQIVGVQSGEMELTLRLQEKNEEDEFQDVMLEAEGEEEPVEITILVTAK